MTKKFLNRDKQSEKFLPLRRFREIGASEEDVISLTSCWCRQLTQASPPMAKNIAPLPENSNFLSNGVGPAPLFFHFSRVDWAV